MKSLNISPQKQYRVLLFINITLICASILAILKSIFISFDIDEGYAIAQAYRLLKGDRLFSEMWEPHQLSSFASAFFMLPFLIITNGNTTGIIIYLRIIGSLIHILIGFWFYFAAKRQFNTTTSLLITLVHINFLPKWVSIPEFEIMHYWAVCILFLALFSWSKQTHKRRFLLLASIALWCAIMCYPTMIILYPAYVGAIFCLSPKNHSAKWSSFLCFTLPLCILGITFLGYLLSYMTFSELLTNISCILMDESHSSSLAHRCTEYLREMISFCIMMLKYMGISFIPAYCICKYLSKKQNKHYRSFRLFLVTLLLFSITLMSMKQMIFAVLGNVNQFYLYFRFLVISLMGMVCYYLCRKDNGVFVLLGIVPGFLSVLASAAITNMTLEIALARVYIAVMASCFIVCTTIQKNNYQNFILKNLVYGTTVIFLLSLLMSKLLLVRVTGCIPISIKMHMAFVTDGPAAGLLLKEELAQIYNENNSFLKRDCKKFCVN